MSAKAKVPEQISEEYYQISSAILDSFPKYRPPLDLFMLKEELCILAPYFSKGGRLSNEQVEEAHNLCEEGNLFVSRKDLPVYSEHIIKQLDLVLVDEHLKASEVADICLRGLAMRLHEFFEQPVHVLYAPLYTDCMVLTEYLWQDPHRIKLFMRRLHTGQHSLVQHSLNTTSVGLWLLESLRGSELTRKEFDRAAVGFLLHDMGMAKLPPFILTKTTPLKVEEKDKIPLHPLVGIKILQKLEVMEEEIRQAVLEHHERLNGSGYPQKTGQLSRIGRICAIADSFSAMIQTKVYAPAVPPLEAAKALSNSHDLYDRTIAARLLTAYVTNEFGLR